MSIKGQLWKVLAFCLGLSIFCAACGVLPVKADYENAEDFEAALNAGEELEGKIVTFTVREFHPDSAFGYNLWAGEHLNFCSSKNPGVKAGDTITVKIVDVRSVIGSWILGYEMIRK